jgi:hypothetical protein
MKTLFITSIYSNLWGTEFGGRPSREYHYRISLQNILNMNPTKCICFTSSKEINELKNLFYNHFKIPQEKLTFVIFDLQNTKYFDEIRKLKNLEEMKRTDRCYEIQYNKFMWKYNINEIYDYDRVYWIDSGLSHGGIFPEKYQKDNSREGHYKISLFTQNYLTHLNQLTSDKVILLSKNNEGQFFWSNQVPQQYYTVFDRSKHIIGGLFGGIPKNFINFCDKFESLLVQLLRNETHLYMEELIMSCLYFNNKNDFELLEFDDWYKRDHHKDPSIKYFYNMFEL